MIPVAFAYFNEIYISRGESEKGLSATLRPFSLSTLDMVLRILSTSTFYPGRRYF